MTRRSVPNSPYFHFCSPGYWLSQLIIFGNFAVNCTRENSTSLIQQSLILYHSPLILNYTHVQSATSYKHFAGGSNILTCKQTCFFSSNGREQQVGTKTAQCSHFTPGSSKTPVFTTTCFTLRCAALHAHLHTTLKCTLVLTM